MRADRLAATVRLPRGPVCRPWSVCFRARGARALVLATFWLWARVGTAVDLPVPERLAHESGLAPESMVVMEPHESDARHEVVVSYTGFPLAALLDRWFGSRWSASDAEVLFLARDGYRSAIAAEALRQERTLLAYARSDGAAFVVDNPDQNQAAVPLGPYYLVWDNRAAPDRLARGTHGWAYQIVAVELRSTRDDRALLPRESGPDIEAGFADTKKYCLGCHAVRGVGGRKYPLDLDVAACRWDDPALKGWLREPSAIRSGTAMPPLNRNLPADQRERSIERIVGYLRAIGREAATCGRTSPRP